MIFTAKKISGLLSYRLNFYCNSAREKLIKFKHLLIIAIGLLVPSVTALMTLLKVPYEVVLSSTHYSAYSVIVALLGIVLLHSVWCIGQRTAIKGGECRTYFKTFPFSAQDWIISDIVMIMIANGLLWIPLLSAIFTPAISPNYFYVKSILLTLSLLFIQYKLLHLEKAISFKNLALRFALVWRTIKTDLALKSCLMIFTVALAYVIASRSHISPLSSCIMAVGLINYISSGWFRLFDQQHQKYAPYFQQFPCYKTKFYFHDLIFIFSYNLIFQLTLGILLLQKGLLRFTTLGFIALLEIPLLVLLSRLEPRYKNKAHIFAILFVLGWAYVTTRILSP